MRNTQVNKALLQAAKSGDLGACVSLLQQGADLKATNVDFRTALQLAAYEGHLDVCRALVERGSDVNYSDPSLLWKPLHIAAVAGRMEICRFLIEQGAEIDLGDHKRRTPLHWAAHCGHLGVCRLLLENGADSRAADENRMTPLQLAVRQGQIDVVRYFFGEYGESADQITADNETLEQLAENQNRPAMVAFLRAYQNSLNTVAAVSEALSNEDNDSPAPSRAGGLSPL
jgi:ankyrin repeat protein